MVPLGCARTAGRPGRGAGRRRVPDLRLVRLGRAQPRPRPPSRTSTRCAARPCTGPLRWRSLAHSYETDILRLRLDAPGLDSRAQWHSLLYALLEGAAEGLEISRDDIDGVVHAGADGRSGLVLFDTVPGGAGSALRDRRRARRGRGRRAHPGRRRATAARRPRATAACAHRATSATTRTSAEGRPCTCWALSARCAPRTEPLPPRPRPHKCARTVHTRTPSRTGVPRSDEAVIRWASCRDARRPHPHASMTRTSTTTTTERNRARMDTAARAGRTQRGATSDGTTPSVPDPGGSGLRHRRLHPRRPAAAVPLRRRREAPRVPVAAARVRPGPRQLPGAAARVRRPGSRSTGWPPNCRKPPRSARCSRCSTPSPNGRCWTAPTTAPAPRTWPSTATGTTSTSSPRPATAPTARSRRCWAPAWRTPRCPGWCSPTSWPTCARSPRRCARPTPPRCTASCPGWTRCSPTWRSAPPAST